MIDQLRQSAIEALEETDGPFALFVMTDEGFKTFAIQSSDPAHRAMIDQILDEILEQA